MKAYRFDFVFQSPEDITDEDLIALGVEVRESITSFLKAKRYKMKLVGTIDISTGEFNDSITAEYSNNK